MYLSVHLQMFLCLAPPGMHTAGMIQCIGLNRLNICQYPACFLPLTEKDLIQHPASLSTVVRLYLKRVVVVLCRFSENTRGAP